MESYQEILEWLYSQVSNYQNIGKSAYKPGFENILKLCEILDNPHQKFKSIHIAGTNGKGSTSNMTASILKEAGYKVGLFTSPHLKNFTERIRINGEECSSEFVYEFLVKIKTYFTEDFNPSFFELTTAMAFEYFAQQKVDIAVIETGIGGRLDSTNIILPEVCAITTISMDHTDLLGDSLEEITLEKAGIIKTGISVVIGEEKEEVKNVLIEVAKERKTEYLDATQIQTIYSSDLTGIYQIQNKKTVLGIVRILKEKGFEIPQNAIEKGFAQVRKNMNFRGRWDVLQKENPMIICDIGHNEDGFKQIVKQLKELEYHQLHMVLGFVKGKDVDRIFPLLPKDAHYYFVKPAVERGVHPDEYEEEIKHYFKNYRKFSTVKEGVNSAKSEALYTDILFIGGSNFVVSEFFLKNICKNKK